MKVLLACCCLAVFLFIDGSFGQRGVRNVGSVCSSDQQCGPNEECHIPLADPPCQKGFCQCKSCHGLANVSSICSPVTFIRPCDENCTDACNDTCKPGSSGEIYPANADCDVLLNKVVCQHCFHARGGLCVPSAITKKTSGGECRSDCECQNGLACQWKGVCQCPDGYRLVNGSQCVLIEFGDPCQSDEDCQGIQGYLLNKGRCLQNRCGCVEGTTPTLVGFEDDTGNNTLFNHTVCMESNKDIVVQVGQACSLYPFEDYDDSPSYSDSDMSSGDSSTAITPSEEEAKFCPPGMACLSCPLPGMGSDDRCRRYTKRPEPSIHALNCSAILARQRNVNRTGTTKILQVCQTANECGPNERCVFLDVIPRCQHGYCACNACFRVDSEIDRCMPVKQLAVGAVCEGGSSELYPVNAMCNLQSKTVTCYDGYSWNSRSKSCMISEAARRRPGESCDEDTQCRGDLKCPWNRRVCGIGQPSSNSYRYSNRVNNSDSDSGDSCFKCPEDDGQSDLCRVYKEPVTKITAENCIPAADRQPITCRRSTSTAGK